MQLVADANVLLSAIIGGRAGLILQHADVEAVFTPAVAIDEVHKYLPILARKRDLRIETLLLTLAALPVTVMDATEYQSHIGEAERRIRRRDPKVVDVLALSLHLALPVWSNDNDFEAGGVEWHTTAEVLKALGIHT